MSDRIDHGILDQQWGVRGQSDAEQLRKTLDDALLAEELGYDSYLLGEHHLAKPAEAFSSRIPWPELVVSHLAALTDSLRIGTGVKVLSLDAAWRTAEMMLTLDLVTGGRALFGLGAGGDEPEIFRDAAVGADARRWLFRDRLGELLELLRSDGRSAFSRELSPVGDAASLVSRILVAARDDETIALAAREQLGFVMGQAEPAATSLQYADRYRAHGGTGEVRLVRIVHVAATDALALESVTPAYRLYSSYFLGLRYYQEAVARLYPTPMPVDLADGLDRMCFVVGGPERVARRLAEEGRASGASRIDILVDIPGLSTAQRHESLRLFAREVAPALRPALERIP
ncbi:LLM class flavin-dependent oxidoreductase [Herbiconiux moechotypicola]|uniref:LLM class flavin-dependent oxidoreductase n=1 Tax=Herbiconiux moechotypicola TaxID=637393 RepID=A0ABN3DKS9_9MICO|nr:LLM class flavin-dependent oxidoreductase [Herbiconiux moechotypicola]MCS5730095.1 LLM class flavin-dependent oxidoreductase [Herbiconiux moechotypicola]